MSNFEFSVSVPEFPGVSRGKLVGVLLFGTITEGVLRLRLTADRVGAPLNKARCGFKSAGGKPADTERICRLIGFPGIRGHN